MANIKTTVKLKGEEKEPIRMGAGIFAKSRESFMVSPKKVDKPGGGMADIVGQKDLKGKTFTMTPEELAQIWSDELPGDSANPGFGQKAGATILERGKLKDYTGRKLVFVFDDTGGLAKVTEPKSGKVIIGGEAPMEGAGGRPGFKCGGEIKKGMAEGGAPEEMAEMATEAPVPEVPATAEASPAPGTAPEGNMDGPFKTYAKIPGIDEELISRGDGLFTQLQTAVEGGDEMAIQEYMDQLKSFVADIESARQDAVSKANDTSLAAAYKEMSAEAKDLMTAFENIIGDQESPEMMAGKPTPAPEAVV